MPWGSRWSDQELQLREEVLRAPLGLTISPQQFADEESQLRFGVTKGNQLIACLLGVPLSETLIKLRQMAVRPNLQGGGVGTFLVENTECALVEKGFRLIELNARKTAIEFYRRLGYETQGDEFIEVTIAHVKMTKSIG